MQKKLHASLFVRKSHTRVCNKARAKVYGHGRLIHSTQFISPRVLRARDLKYYVALFHIRPPDCTETPCRVGLPRGARMRIWLTHLAYIIVNDEWKCTLTWEKKWFLYRLIQEQKNNNDTAIYSITYTKLTVSIYLSLDNTLYIPEQTEVRVQWMTIDSHVHVAGGSRGREDLLLWVLWGWPPDPNCLITT